jgi:hypothetical protein
MMPPAMITALFTVFSRDQPHRRHTRRSTSRSERVGAPRTSTPHTAEEEAP